MRNSPKMKKPLRGRRKKASKVRKERGLNSGVTGNVDRLTEKVSVISRSHLQRSTRLRQKPNSPVKKSASRRSQKPAIPVK
ncbi:hypothetical protein F2Q68_00031280 [Brassica cretica]|uniref:Uncharacterized protein n=1 Tax=Brassica cretica TaxID=69181 RepID=A0A8S9GD82_BRACR|nr:hypothetical protein F2Q68_00031280 [Brassica cretica]